MYLFKFIVFTLIYSWGRAFEIAQNNYNHTQRFHTLHMQIQRQMQMQMQMQMPYINYKQIERVIGGVCQPSCYIAVVSAQGWQEPQFYPDYQTFDPGYHSPPNIPQQKTRNFSGGSSTEYTPIGVIYRTRPNQQQKQERQIQQSVQVQPQCECKRLNECPAILEKIYQSQQQFSDWMLSNLPDPQCGYYPNDAVVCCPKPVQPKVTIIKSTTEKPWIWEVIRNIPNLSSKGSSYNNNNNNFEQGFERWDHSQFNKFTATTPTPAKQNGGKLQNYNGFKYGDDDYHYNLIDFEDPDTHKNCPPSFNDDFEMPTIYNKAGHSQKQKASTSPNRGGSKLPARRRFQNQGTRLNLVNGQAQSTNQKTNGRQPVKRFVNSPLCGISVNTRIVGGREIAAGQFPWMARLAYRNRTSGRLTYRCAGSVISDRYIVTAAHCVTNLVSALEVFLVRIGELDTKRNLDCELNPLTCVVPQDYDIQKIISHEKYDTPKYANDIALIKLVRPLNASQITPICLPVGELANADKRLTGQSGIIAGWGSKLAGGVRQNPALQYVILPIVNRTLCAASYAQFSANSRSPIIVTDSQICAQGMENMDACQGDSGGPLMFEGPTTNARFTLLGLVSFGPRTCGVSNFPGVYSRVSSYLDWIAKNMD